MSLIITGKIHGDLQKTAKGYIQRVLTDSDLISVFTKDPSVLKPNSNGEISLKVNAKDNFVFSA